jgi:hypothetical protein
VCTVQDRTEGTYSLWQRELFQQKGRKIRGGTLQSDLQTKITPGKTFFARSVVSKVRTQPASAKIGTPQGAHIVHHPGKFETVFEVL